MTHDCERAKICIGASDWGLLIYECPYCGKRWTERGSE